MEKSNERLEWTCEKDQIFYQQMKLIRKKQQDFDQRWELLLKEQEREQQSSLERLRKSLSYLTQVILEKQGVPNPSYVASQLFDIMLESKEEKALQPTFQVFDEIPKRKIQLPDFCLRRKIELVEQLFQLQQTTSVEDLLKPQTKKLNPDVTTSYFINKLIIDVFKQAKFQDVPLKDVI
ncbi:hypothetical protein M5689_024177 [Euphorbia peplus]|nr:hypothetical protein M5689_024177 [Euphorbia peplus]